MSEDINNPKRDVVVSGYQRELDNISRDFGGIPKDRLKLLLTTGAKSLKHFLEGEYGSPEKCTPDSKPVYWSYVRFLTYDALRPKFGHGKTEFANQDYGKDKFLRDLTKEANFMARTLPGNINYQEWIFLTKVWSEMLMEDPMLVEKGYVSEIGRQNLISNALMAGPSDDMYVSRFNQWKKQYSSGQRGESIQGEVVE